MSIHLNEMCLCQIFGNFFWEINEPAQCQRISFCFSFSSLTSLSEISPKTFRLFSNFYFFFVLSITALHRIIFFLLISKKVPECSSFTNWQIAKNDDKYLGNHSERMKRFAFILSDQRFVLHSFHLPKQQFTF